jgi:rod shape-determining protein MreC
VVLLSDPSSRIPVITSEGRVPAIVQGQGAGAFLEVKFIPRNDPVSPGEILLSSGLGGVFPKGIPVARVVEVTPADVSLFQRVYAEPLLALRYYEELLVLSRTDGFDAGQPVMTPAVTNASSPDVPPADEKSPEAKPAAQAPAAAGPSVTPPSVQEPSTITRHPVRKKP